MRIKQENLNSTDEEVRSLINAIRYICPDEIEILTVSCPSTEKWVKSVSEERLREIAGRFISEFGAEKVKLVLKGKKKKAKVLHRDLEEEVYALLLRRPCTFEQTWHALNMDSESLCPVLEKLPGEGKIDKISSEIGEYYRAN